MESVTWLVICRRGVGWAFLDSWCCWDPARPLSFSSSSVTPSPAPSLGTANAHTKAFVTCHSWVVTCLWIMWKFEIDHGLDEIKSHRSPTFIFPVPTPCSPVHVPSMDRAVWTMRWFSLSASLRSSSWLGSNRIIVWKFPSPAWAITKLKTCTSQREGPPG